MEEIKIGEYLRTKKGRIAKATTINNVRYTYCGAKVRGKLELVGTERKVIGGKYELEDIAKHSFNLIDLIEVGDIIITKHPAFEKEFWERIEDKKCLEIRKKFIEEKSLILVSIVTKEQFKSIEYEV